MQNKRLIALTTLAVIGIVLSLLSSYRLEFGNLEIALEVNLERIALAVAAGLAFAGTGAYVGDSDAHITKHVLGFASISFASTVLLAGAYLQWPSVISMTTAVLIGIGVWRLGNLLLKHDRRKNIWSAAVLTISFVLTLVNFVVASTIGDGVGMLVYWLQGNLLSAGNYGLLALVVSLLLFIWTLSSEHKQVPIALLFGFGLGIAGPVLFVGCLTPLLIKRLSGANNGKLFTITCAAVGALVVVLADSIPRQFIGGYATSLIIPLGLVAIPTILYYQRARLQEQFPSPVRSVTEATFATFWLFGFMFVLVHIVRFASDAT